MLFAYASKLNIQPNINFFITKVYQFIHHVRRKTTKIYEHRVKQMITKEYKGNFFNDFVEVTCSIQA